MLGGKWRLLILKEVAAGNKRYGELKRAIPEISEKMLSQELKNLVESRLLLRTNFGEVPPRVDYTLTAHGEKAQELLRALAQFGESYMKEEMKA